MGLTARQKMSIQRVTVVVFFLPFFLFFMWFGSVIRFSDTVNRYFDIITLRTKVEIGAVSTIIFIILGIVSFWRISISLNDIIDDTR